MRYLRIALIVLFALVAIVIAIGYALPIEHHASGETSAKASPDSVFALLTDIDQYPEWRSGLKSVERLPPDGGKTRFREKSSGGELTFVIEKAENPRQLVMRIDDPGLPFGGTWTFDLVTAGGGRTTVRITEDGKIFNPAFRFASRFVLGYDATLKRYLADIAKRFPG
jgi:uncharacterized protein YndB with AHSA1/START domain